MERFQPELGELVAELRAECGFSSQAHLAEDAGIDVRTLASLEKGSAIQPAKLGAVCSSLKTTISELKSKAVDRRRSRGTLKQPTDGDATEGGDWFSSVFEKLDEVDAEVNGLFGRLSTPTRTSGDEEFSSRRLVSSLASLGLPPEVVFRLLEKLPLALAKVVPDHEQMSTGHVRSAVAQVISELSIQDVSDTDIFRLKEEVARRGGGAANTTVTVEEIKFDWASRYARRYGNPSQIMTVREDDGGAKRLDYSFIKGELIPHVLRRILGEDFRVEEGGLVNPSIVAEMARTALEEFRRLGVYSLRYKTALWLIEDIALLPPHPWVISEATKTSTIAYDFERAKANLDGIKEASDGPSFSLRHRFSEVVHHYCSAILGTYSSFLGHKHTSSLAILRHWLAIQDDNPVLWERCDLRLIDSDLSACRIAKQEFNSLLKRIEVILAIKTVPPRSELLAKAATLGDIAERLSKRRLSMQILDQDLAGGDERAISALYELTSEMVFSCFGARKVFPVTDRSDGRAIGFTATPAFEGTVLSGRQPLCIFIPCSSSEPDGIQSACRVAVDQLNAHRMSDTCLIVTAHQPNPEFQKAVREAEAQLPGNQIVRVFSIDSLRKRRRGAPNIVDFIDDVFSGS